MSHHQAKALRARVKALKGRNDALRRALRAERAFWDHLLFCEHCQLQRLGHLLCPASLVLKHEYRKLAGAALKHQKKAKK